MPDQNPEPDPRENFNRHQSAEKIMRISYYRQKIKTEFTIIFVVVEKYDKENVI